MSRISISLPLAALVIFCSLSTPAEAQNYGRHRTVRSAGQVVINGVALSYQQRLALARRGVRVPAGRYWYDRRSGVWGMEGGPARGVIAPYLRVGGRLNSNASRGRSGVFINGRQLTHGEASVLRRALRRLPRGYYWLDHNGNAGRVGGRALVNLRKVIKRSQGRRNYLIRGPGSGRKRTSLAGDGRTTCVNSGGYTRCYSR